MSELKLYNTKYEKVLDEVYLKSEADKVLADKDAKILALDAEVFKQKHHAKLFFDERNYAETQLHRQKYKRCLAMAKWCDNAIHGWMRYKESFSSHDRYVKVMLFTKWHNHWLELAEKFKDKEE